MEPNLFKYVWRYSRRDQIVILAIVVASLLIYLVSLELPKRIVNEAIQGEAFLAETIPDPDDACALKCPAQTVVDPEKTAPFLDLSLPLPDWLGGPVHLFDGFQLPQIEYLFALCFSYLFFVVLNGWMKQLVNTEKGRLGERMLRRLRFELYDRVLQFPLLHFRKVKQAEIATMVKDEVEPLGGFIGDAFITPAYLGGMAATALLFIFLQNLYMGLVTVTMLAVQITIIPKLRVKILRLGKQRQITARQLAGRIAESVDGATEIHVHDTSNYERADIVQRLGAIFQIRFELYQRKFLVKYINNMLAQTTPFLYFMIGGYFALKGQFDVGTLLAVISAYKDLPSPIKELIDWDQQRQDVQIKYDQVIEQFSPPGLLPTELQAVDADNTIEAGTLSVQRVAYVDESGGRLIDEASFDIAPGEHFAIIGGNNSGKEAVAALVGRLIAPLSGQISYGGRDLASLPEAVTGRRFAYIGDETYLLPLSLVDNLLYSLKHRPVHPAKYHDRALARFEMHMTETRRAGNPDLDIHADWLDLEGAGVADRAELEARLGQLLRVVELEDDVYQFGLRGRLDFDEANGDGKKLAELFLQAREAMRGRLTQPSLAALVEPFDPERYNRNMTVAENVLFGTALKPAFTPEALGDNSYLAATLARSGVADDLVQLGAKIAETMVELFADLPAGHPFFEQFSFISAEDLPLYQQLVTRLHKSGIEGASPDDKQRLIALTFPYIEARHRLDLIDDKVEARLLVARRAFRENLPRGFEDAIEFYDPDRYNAAASVQDNILFGRLVFGQAQSAQKVGAVLSEVVESLGLKPRVIAVGLGYNVGAAGKKLSITQRQKVGLIRALLKRPQLVILNNTVSAFDEPSQRRLVKQIRDDIPEAAVICVTNTPALARSFDRVAVMQEGRIVEIGKPADLDRPESRFRALVELVG